jgi:hypothetical protein
VSTAKSALTEAICTTARRSSSIMTLEWIYNGSDTHRTGLLRTHNTKAPGHCESRRTHTNEALLHRLPTAAYHQVPSGPVMRVAQLCRRQHHATKGIPITFEYRRGRGDISDLRSVSLPTQCLRTVERQKAGKGCCLVHSKIYRLRAVLRTMIRWSLAKPVNEIYATIL